MNVLLRRATTHHLPRLLQLPPPTPTQTDQPSSAFTKEPWIWKGFSSRYFASKRWLYIHKSLLNWLLISSKERKKFILEKKGKKQKRDDDGKWWRLHCCCCCSPIWRWIENYSIAYVVRRNFLPCWWPFRPTFFYADIFISFLKLIFSQTGLFLWGQQLKNAMRKQIDIQQP